MVDETFDRLYREGRGELNRAISSGFRNIGGTLGIALEALHRIEWNAPWAPRSRAKCN
jgi:hypothetical protein